jgi:hypothetical protein
LIFIILLLLSPFPAIHGIIIIIIITWEKIFNAPQPQTA